MKGKNVRGKHIIGFLALGGLSLLTRYLSVFIIRYYNRTILSTPTHSSNLISKHSTYQAPCQNREGIHLFLMIQVF